MAKPGGEQEDDGLLLTVMLAGELAAWGPGDAGKLERLKTGRRTKN